MDIVTAQLGNAALEKVAPNTKPAPGADSSAGSSFEKILDFQTNQHDNNTAQLMEFVDQNFGLQGNQVSAVDASSVHVEISKGKEVETISNENHFFDLLKDFNDDQLQFGKIREMLTSGKKFSTQDLLVTQMGVQRFSVELELAAKGVEGLTRAITTPINMNLS